MPTDKKVVAELVRLANRKETVGWECFDQGRRWRFVGPKGIYFAPKTPGGHRSVQNLKAELRKRGFPC